MQFALGVEYRLADLAIELHEETRVFFVQLRQTGGHLVFTTLFPGMDGHAQKRFGKLNAWQLQRSALGAERVGGVGVFELDQSDYIAGLGAIDLGPLIPAQVENLADPLG